MATETIATKEYERMLDEAIEAREVATILASRIAYSGQAPEYIGLLELMAAMTQQRDDSRAPAYGKAAELLRRELALARHKPVVAA